MNLPTSLQVALSVYGCPINGVPSCIRMPEAKFTATEINGVSGVVDFHVEPEDMN